MTRILLALLIASCTSGCMQSIAQPGQTPAQVAACSTDATWHNILTGASAVLATGAGVESTVATQTDPQTAKGLAIGGAVTAGLAAASLGAGQYFGSVYNADGCSPALVGKPATAMVRAPITAADGRDYRFGELGWKPVER